MMRKFKLICIGTIFCLWFTTLIFLFQWKTQPGSSVQEYSIVQKALLTIEQLEKENSELKTNLHSIRKSQDEITTTTQRELRNHTQCQSELQVTKEHEVLVRKAKNNLVELLYAFDKQLLETENPTALAAKAATFKANFVAQLQAALIDAEDLQFLNEEWRIKEEQALHNLILSRIQYLQNPADCASAKKLICKINIPCGLGCQLHHMLYCAMFAYGLKRTLILESKPWSYNADGWEAVFLPVSETCKEASGSRQSWKGVEASMDAQNVVVPLANSVGSTSPFRAQGFPKDIAERLIRLHGNPNVWWTGVFMQYLLRPQPWLQETVESTITISGLATPCVGMHVRRTDKVGTEASFHTIEEYMKHVIAWYDKLDVRLSKENPARNATRRVYLASDDSSVLSEARKKYPDYVFYGDTKISDSAAVGRRYSKEGLRGLLVDVYTLTKCDYLVCTISSQICRVVYELMQARHPDASDRIHSLDDVYWLGGQYDHEQRAIFPHQGKGDEISFEVGDTIRIAGNHWDGYSKGTHLKSKKLGLYPSYKVEELFRLINYPTFEELKKER